MSEIHYFAYGANREAKMMAAITGIPQDKLVGQPAVLYGYQLAVQRLDQLPDKVLPTAPVQQSPRDVVAGAWGKDSGFESYVIYKNKHSKVSGTLWTLSKEAREIVRDWELIDFGWYHDISVRVKLEDGTKVDAVTEAIYPEWPIDRNVDGMDYPAWLMKSEDFDARAEQSRLDYEARNANDT